MNKRIYNYSIHLLARQDYSEFKLRQKLLSKKDNSKEEVDEVISKLKEKGLINESRYKHLFIRKWLIKGEGKEKISLRASAEHLTLNKDDFASVTSELNISEESTIEKIIQKKLRGVTIPDDSLEKRKIKEKIFRYLASKGHSFDKLNSVLNKFF